MQTSSGSQGEVVKDKERLRRLRMLANREPCGDAGGEAGIEDMPRAVHPPAACRAPDPVLAAGKVDAWTLSTCVVYNSAG
jgi:hypothetical protein